MTIRPILLSVLLFTALLDVASAQRVVPPPRVFDEVRDVSDSVHRVTMKLIDVINDTTISEDTRQRAMMELASLGRDEAVLPLFNQLLCPAGAISGPGPLTSFPAARALSQYGSNVYPTLPAVVLEERSPEYVYVLACLLHTIDGKRIAIMRVEKLQAAKPLSATQKVNYTRLINRLKTTDYDDPLKWPRLNLKQQVKVDVSTEPAQ